MNKIKMYYNNQINKMGKKQKITFYASSVILILLVLLCIGGLTYSWFSSIITGNDTAQSNVVETGTLSITYTNGQEIRGESIEPGWSETKSFTVENTGTVPATYNINWETLTNTFVNKQDLVLTLSSDNDGGNSEEEQISSSGNHVNILSNITIQPGVIQTYTMTVTYKNENYDQSSDMGKQLLGKIEVRDANEEILASGPASDVIISKYKENNDEGLIRINQPATVQTPSLTEYRYSGSNDTVKNYVNFNNETWRIIGVFPTDDGTGNIENRVKIIREESIGNYSWDSSPSGINDFIWNNTQYYGGGVNQWGESGDYEGADLMRLLNPGYESENVNNSLYWNRGIGSCYTDHNNAISSCDFSSTGLIEESKQMIEDALWYTGAGTIISTTTSQSYEQERSNTTSPSDIGITVTKTTNWIGKVGLMYPSDYGYASRECYESRAFYQTDATDYRQEICTNTNWLYNGTYQWLLSNYIEYNGFVAIARSQGYIYYDRAGASVNIRPTLYLSSSVKITSGTGTIDDEYQLSLR